MNNYFDIVDDLFKELMDLKRILRAEKIKNSFQTVAKKTIDKHLSEIGEDTEIPKN